MTEGHHLREQNNEENFEKQTASWFELDKETSVEAAVRETIHHTFSDNQAEKIETCLKEWQLPIALESCPESLSYNIEYFTDIDWNFIRASQIPTLALYAVNHYYDDLELMQKYPLGFEDEAWIRSLPLIHGTSFSNVMKLANTGKFLSNRKVYEENGKESVNHVETAINTTTEDRLVGLDQYIFAHFARPDSRYEQQEITVVLDPELMKQEDSFLTEQDYLDFFNYENEKDKNSPLNSYIKTISMTPYFYKQAYAHISATPIGEKKDRGSYLVEKNTLARFVNGQDREVNNVGHITFSTWEVKLPKVGIESVRKLIFKNQDQMTEFKEKYGESIECLYEPNLRPGKYHDTLNIPGEYNRQYKILAGADYEYRLKALSDIPDDHKKKKIVFLKNGDACGIESNPFLTMYGNEYRNYNEVQKDILYVGESAGPYARLGMKPGPMMGDDDVVFVAEIEVVEDRSLYTHPNIPARITKIAKFKYSDIGKLAESEGNIDS